MEIIYNPLLHDKFIKKIFNFLIYLSLRTNLLILQIIKLKLMRSIFFHLHKLLILDFGNQ